ncbi:MAG: crossover junction endodeoxyribonuclease RuvC [Candidatus Dormibacteria bacterium]
MPRSVDPATTLGGPGGPVILGIDPGIARTGFGVVRLGAGVPAVVECGCIETPPGPDPARLLELVLRLEALFERHAPAEAAVERLFFGQNSRSALQVGQARGVAILALARAGIEISEYTPVQVKQALTGYGAAGKDQVEVMVRRRLGIVDRIRPDDTADALAVALCHVQNRGLLAARRAAGAAG